MFGGEVGMVFLVVFIFLVAEGAAVISLFFFFGKFLFRVAQILFTEIETVFPAKNSVFN